MELKEFVAQSIVQIMEGTKEAQEKVKELNALVNPYEDVIDRGMMGTTYVAKPSIIEFEVSITNEDKQGNSGGLSVLFGAISVGGKVDSAETKIALNRLKFKVPVVYPKYPIRK
jgi:hypothetical protein